MTPAAEHDPSNIGHALHCQECYNKRPDIGVRPHQTAIPEEPDIRYDFTGSISGFDFDPNILASTLDFGAGMPTQKNRAEYLEHHGREDEAFERDE